MPTWNVARAPGQISALQQEAPWGPQEAPQSLLACDTAVSRGPRVTAQTADINLAFDFAPFKVGDEIGGLQGGECV